MEHNCKCTQERRFSHIEEDIKEIREDIKDHTNKINTLYQNDAENRVYVKQIFEKIQDLSVLFKSASSESGKVLIDNSKTWQKVVLELIKVVIQTVGIVAAIIGSIKFLG